MTDKWLRFGNPWEIARPEIAFEVKLGGHTERYTTSTAAIAYAGSRETGGQGVPTTRRSSGYRVTPRTLCGLWRAEAAESFDFEAFNRGDYYGAVDEKVASENITKVLYPNDEPMQGKELRLAAAVLLRVLLTAGHAPHSQDAAASRSSDFMKNSPYS